MTPVQMRTRTIPSSAEPLPVIGCGTYLGFDREPGSPEFAQLPRVLAALCPLAAEGHLIDVQRHLGAATGALSEPDALGPA